jgi:hypothetical protein
MDKYSKSADILFLMDIFDVTKQIINISENALGSI